MINAPIMAMARGLNMFAPDPTLKARGKRPKAAANEVISTG